MTIAIAIVVALGAASSAAASGLSLVPIAGPDGAVPFVSPGGFGPTFVASPPGDTHRVFVGTKDGYIYIVKDGVTLPTPFLDLHTQVSTTNEDGMFSIAFDPSYATTRRFYVDYSDTVANNATNKNLDNYHLDAFLASAANPDVADPSTQTQILFNPTSGCQDMSSPHYGGQLAFGPDGHLWLSLGDGGDGGGNPNTRGPTCDRSSPLWAPDLTSIRGKILRIDPQPTAAPDASGNRYTIPSDNPLIGQGGGVRTEIWADGLRNPWRFSFDSASPHDLIIGDVGNEQQEEVDRVSSTLAPGAQPPFFGWPCTEGDLPFFGSNVCASSPAPVAPQFVFAHTGSPANPDCTAIIGGPVLHDPSLGGDYDGRYMYGYFCAGTSSSLSGHIFTTDFAAANPAGRDEGIGVTLGLSSFGVDACGHPYATNVVKGGLWRIEGPTPGACGEFTPPQTTLTSAPSGVVTSSTQQVSFVSSVGGSSFACSLDGAGPTSCTSPKTYTGLSDGPHTISVAATDEAGNTDPTPATASFIVDTAVPNTSITSAPSGSVASTSAQVSFSASEADVTFTCKLDSGSAASCTSPKTYSGLSQGSHTVTVTATDAAHNSDPTPATAAWTVDTMAPDTTITAAPSGTVATASASISFGSTEAGSTFTCRLDTGAATSCTSPKTYGGLADGAHSVTVTATDAAGNPDPTPATRSWTVDTTPPQTTIDSSPPVFDNHTSATIAFSAGEPGSTFTCSLDGGAASACTSPKTYSGLADGLHTVSVVATDAVGNADGSPATASWTVDTAAPDTTITSGPPASDTHSSATFTFTASENAVTFTCSLDGAAAAPCSSPQTYSGLGDGPHTLAVRATDAAGHADPSPASASWTVTLSGPPATTTTTAPPTTTTTPATGQSLPPIHVSLGGLKALTFDRHGRLKLSLSGMDRDVRGLLTLRSGARVLAPAFRFRMARGQGVTLMLVLSSPSRRSLRRHHHLTGRLTLTLTGDDGRSVSASAMVRILGAA